MEPAPPSSFSIDDAERQRRAFAYLRDEARAAHSEGDGILVQHLAAVAIRGLLDLAKGDRLRLRLRDYYWAPVFSLHWLVRDYSLHILVHEARPQLIEREPEGDELRRLLSMLIFLVEQSLSAATDLPDALEGLALQWVGGREEIEAGVLLSFIGELLWYRDPQGETWLRLLQHWQEVGGEHLRPTLRETADRLRVQSAIAEPGGRYPLPKEPPEALATDARDLYRLWRSMLACDFEAVNAMRASLLPRTAFDSRLARILFDVHHRLRGTAGPFGDPQELGLTRRNLQTSLAKAEGVPLERDQLFAEMFAESLRKGSAEVAASTRFHCFRLAMLKEIFALRAWDFSEWREALEDQSDSVFEVLRVDLCPPQFAAAGIRLAVQARAFSDKDPFALNAVTVLDRTGEDERARLVRQLLRAHVLQCHDVLTALAEISDAIPTDVLPEVADWCVRFVRELAQPLQKVRGVKAAPLAFWKDILPEVEDAASLCARLFPAFSEEAAHPWAWRSEGSDAIRSFLRYAAPDHAVQVMERMIAEQNVEHQPWHIERWALIYDTLVLRPELRQTRLMRALEELLAAPQIAGLPVFPHYLRRLEAGEIGDRPLSDVVFAAWLRERAHRLSATRDEQTFSSQWFGLVEWTEEDAEMLTHLIRAVDEPDRSCGSIGTMMGDLAYIAETGNAALNRQIAAALSRWLATPPIGENRNQLSPFSIVRVTEPDQRHVLEALAFLSATLLRKGSTTDVLQTLYPWLRAMAVEPPAPAAASLAYTAFRCSLVEDGPAASELMSAGREIALRALSRADDHPEWRSALCRTLWKLSALIDETMDEASSLTGALRKPAADGMLQLLQAVVPRLVTSGDARVRAAAARVAHTLNRAGFSTEEVTAALEKLTSDARARVRRRARGET